MLIGVVSVLILASLSLFIVDQRQNALVFRLGEVVDIKTASGLYGKVPLLDNVRLFDMRILTIDSSEPERFLTSEKKNVLVDLFVKWRITDPRLYYVAWVATKYGRARVRRMEAERKRVANELRSTGAAEAEQIRAHADRQREVSLAQAYRDAQRVKGEGDARATAIYASAYALNPEFFAFYRSLEAYKQSFRNKSDVLVLSPDSEFLKYFKRGGKAAN
jgi:modulator of FtsH protease HflC